METTPGTIKNIVMVESAIINGVTFKSIFVATVMISDRKSKGTKYIVNFIHKKVFSVTGADFTSQNASPSVLTAG
jgi:hypothetical protein